MQKSEENQAQRARNWPAPGIALVVAFTFAFVDIGNESFLSGLARTLAAQLASVLGVYEFVKPRKREHKPPNLIE